MFVRKPKKQNWSLLLNNQRNKRFVVLLYLTLLFSLVLQAQYTGVINSNNPGFAESPYAVGLGVYQFESNLYFRKTSTEPVFSNPDSFGYELQYRMSYFYEQLEFQANFGFQNDKVAFENIFNSHYYTTGISDFSIGAKYLFFESEFTDKSKEIRSWKKRHAFDWRRFIPSIAVLGGINTNLVGPVHKQQSITGRVGLLFQNDLSSDMNLVTNVFYNNLGGENPEINLVISSTYSITDRISTFFEYQNIFREFVNDVNLGSGLAYLFNRNLQINGSLRFMMEGSAQGVYGSLGVSYRLDRHVDPPVEFDDVGNVVKSAKDEIKALQDKKRVGRWLDKINIFKKNINKQKIDLNKRTLESIERNVNVDDKTLYQERKDKGLPVRTRPKRVRVKPTKLRPVKKKKDPAVKEEERKKKQQAKEDRLKQKAADKAKRKADKEAKKQQRAKDKADKKKEDDKKEEDDKENGN